MEFRPNGGSLAAALQGASGTKIFKAVAHARPLTGIQKPRNVIPSEARNLALSRADRTKKIRARFLASLGMTVHFRADIATGAESAVNTFRGSGRAAMIAR